MFILTCLINVGPTFIDFGFFSRPYSLIKGPTFIKFWNFCQGLQKFSSLMVFCYINLHIWFMPYAYSRPCVYSFWQIFPERNGRRQRAWKSEVVSKNVVGMTCQIDLSKLDGVCPQFCHPCIFLKNIWGGLPSTSAGTAQKPFILWRFCSVDFNKTHLNIHTRLKTICL